MYVLLGLSHRVDRVLRLFSSRRYWDSPTPSPACECVLLPFGGGGGGYSRLGGEGVGVPIPTRGQTLLYFRYICTVLCGLSGKFYHGPGKQCSTHFSNFITWAGSWEAVATATEELMAFPAYVSEKTLLANHLLCTFLQECPFLNLRAQLLKQYLKFDTRI
jgi:hypothetical protein